MPRNAEALEALLKAAAAAAAVAAVPGTSLARFRLARPSENRLEAAEGSPPGSYLCQWV